MERHPKGHHAMRQDTKGREKSRKIHYKMRKDKIFIDKICLFSLE